MRRLAVFVVLAVLLSGCTPAAQPAPRHPIEVSVWNGRARFDLTVETDGKPRAYAAYLSKRASGASTVTVAAPYGQPTHFVVTSAGDGRVIFDSETTDRDRISQMPPSVAADALAEGQFVIPGAVTGLRYTFTLPQGVYEARLKTYSGRRVSQRLRIVVQ